MRGSSVAVGCKFQRCTTQVGVSRLKPALRLHSETRNLIEASAQRCGRKDTCDERIIIDACMGRSGDKSRVRRDTGVCVDFQHKWFARFRNAKIHPGVACEIEYLPTFLARGF